MPKLVWHEENGLKYLMCRTCGAWGDMECSTASGRDHVTRRRDEISAMNGAT